jgi:hypothetical protein
MSWESAAASSFRAQVLDDCASYDRVVTAMDEAASALDHLASTMRGRQDELPRLAAVAGRAVEQWMT